MASTEGYIEFFFRVEIPTGSRKTEILDIPFDVIFKESESRNDKRSWKVKCAVKGLKKVRWIKELEKLDEISKQKLLYSIHQSLVYNLS